ncbi:MAG: aminotransferase class I/II-fold pyridoxal phosphate-dependent enzyme [Deltaproteobacteria bacterium]|nr:aminotransferase class I/II-fold pyridoxal phosphate-dependent enzyme [Deltaproteobacteria bacterium]MDA8298958.1 aminotransferase class I/II-fold pyridoxal phosphate-dependent enzyme [Deltaproteobacteria bacterium]
MLEKNQTAFLSINENFSVNPRYDEIHGGNIIDYGYESGIIDFSANINPLGLSPKASEILKDFKKLKFFTENYPKNYPEPFVNALSFYHGVEKQFICEGAGASELIFNITARLNPKNVIIAEPSFYEYERAALSKLQKSKIFHINTYLSENFELKEKSLSKLINCISENIVENDVVFIANPSNPAGNITPLQTIIKILKKLKEKKAFLILDESFMDFCEDFSAKHLIAGTSLDDKKLKVVDKFDNLIIIRSMTKFFAMPGLRIGYAFAKPFLAKLLSETSIPWKITSLSEQIAYLSICDDDYILRSRLLIKELRKDFENKLKKIRFLRIIPGSANFFLIKITNESLNAKNLKNYLLECGILIRNCGNYRGLNDKYFRIAVRKKSENDYFISRLKKIKF